MLVSVGNPELPRGGSIAVGLAGMVVSITTLRAAVIPGMVWEWSEATAAEKTRKVEGVQRPDGLPPAAPLMQRRGRP